MPKKFVYEYIKEQIESVEGYKLLSETYINSSSKLKMQCPKGHIFEIKYNDFQQGQRCPLCSNRTSKGEKEVLQIVKKFTDEMIIENDRTQITNSLTGRNLELDIWIPSLKKAIEYNGKYWHSNDLIKDRDKEKLKQCKEKGIKLLVINDEDWINNREVNMKKIEIWMEE